MGDTLNRAENTAGGVTSGHVRPYVGEGLAGQAATSPQSDAGVIACVVIVMAILFVIAFGFVVPAKIIWWIVSAPFVHFHKFWVLVRELAGLVFVLAIVGWLQMRFGPQNPNANSSGRGDHGYGPHAIEDFREKSAFGDASLAQKQEIARALAGQNGEHTPKFED